MKRKRTTGCRDRDVLAAHARLVKRLRNVCVPLKELAAAMRCAGGRKAVARALATRTLGKSVNGCVYVRELPDPGALRVMRRAMRGRV